MGFKLSKTNVKSDTCQNEKENSLFSIRVERPLQYIEHGLLRAPCPRVVHGS